MAKTANKSTFRLCFALSCCRQCATPRSFIAGMPSGLPGTGGKNPPFFRGFPKIVVPQNHGFQYSNGRLGWFGGFGVPRFWKSPISIHEWCVWLECGFAIPFHGGFLSGTCPKNIAVVYILLNMVNPRTLQFSVGIKFAILVLKGMGPWMNKISRLTIILIIFISVHSIQNEPFRYLQTSVFIFVRICISYL